MAISTRVREQSGFGLVELLIAMTVMVVGITAIVAGLSSGIIAVKRAADESTAAALLDTQMEAYRALPNCSVYLDAATIPTGGTYAADPAYAGTQTTTNTPLVGTSTCTTPAPAAQRDAQKQLTGADGRSYWVNAYIVSSTVATGAPVKNVTLVVRDPGDTKTLIRESSTFAPPTGCKNDSPPTGC